MKSDFRVIKVSCRSIRGEIKSFRASKRVLGDNIGSKWFKSSLISSTAAWISKFKNFALLLYLTCIYISVEQWFLTGGEFPTSGELRTTRWGMELLGKYKMKVIN